MLVNTADITPADSCNLTPSIPTLVYLVTSSGRDIINALAAMHSQPLQLDHGVLQDCELLHGLPPLRRGLGALGRNALDDIVGELAHHIGRENRGKFLEQTPLDSQRADRIDEGLEGNLFYCQWAWIVKRGKTDLTL